LELKWTKNGEEWRRRNGEKEKEVEKDEGIYNLGRTRKRPLQDGQFTDLMQTFIG
jgi:hypothetical protein